MMQLTERVDLDLREAMKAKDTIKMSTLRMLKAAALNTSIEKKAKGPLDDAEFIKVINKLIKQRRDSIEEFKKGNRQDLVQREESEIVVLNGYLPKSLSEGELDQIIDQAIKEAGASKRSDMGKVMKIVLEKTCGRAEGGVVSKKVSAKLA